MSLLQNNLSRDLAGKRGDLVLALFVVAVAVMLVLPLPTPILDLLLALNLSLALLLLFAGLYIPNALSLLAFPSLLLLTTLFRLSLNVASTRLILLQGDAGRVIEAFGTFLIRGEVAVGIIIFLIITIVNLVVIAKGSSRVSEVAARFALDALPGKQNAIDADLRSGLLTPDEASQRREDLRKESQLYGSMDGAMKFVQGDAVAGLFIIATNIFGGIYIGISQGMAVGDAVETYTVLTIGDGLVSQIPALLISICAGIVVTRISSSESATLASDLTKQLLNRPITLMLSGALIILLGVMPGLPWVPFMAIGLLFVLSGWWISWREGRILAGFPAPTLGLTGFGDGESNIGFSRVGRLPGQQTFKALPGGAANSLEQRGSAGTPSLIGPLIGIGLENDGLYAAFRERASRYQYWYRELQSDFFEATGLTLPDYAVFAVEDHGAPVYRLTIRGHLVESGPLPLDQILVEMHPNSATQLGCEVARAERHPIDDNLIFWTANKPGLRKTLEQGSIRAFDPFEFVALRAARYLRQNPDELVSITDVYGWVKQFEKRHPGLVLETLNKEFVSVPRLTEMLQELVRQRVNVGDFSRILEAVASYCTSFGSTLTAEDQFDLNDLVAFVRKARARDIISTLTGSGRALRAMILSRSTEQLIEKLPSQSKSLLDLTIANSDSQEHWSTLQRSWEGVSGRWTAHGSVPLVVLCKPELFVQVVSVSRLLQQEFQVLSFEEIDQRTRVEVAAVW